MSQYMLLIYDDETLYPTMDLDEQMGFHRAFHKRIPELGATHLSDNALQVSTNATTIRGGELTDGPFAETKEVLGGYYLIEAPDLDVALAVGRECPTVGGSIEVRPIEVFS